MKITMFAFYGGSATPEKGFGGEETYLGRKSDGLERRYYGPSFDQADKMVDQARSQSGHYRLEKMTFEHLGLNSPVLSCKVETIKSWPQHPRRKKKG